MIRILHHKDTDQEIEHKPGKNTYTFKHLFV